MFAITSAFFRIRPASFCIQGQTWLLLQVSLDFLLLHSIPLWWKKKFFFLVLTPKGLILESNLTLNTILLISHVKTTFLSNPYEQSTGEQGNWKVGVYSRNCFIARMKQGMWAPHAQAGTPSPPLALFVVILPKTHLTSHSRMSGSRWVITPLWFSGSGRSFLYSSSVYSCYLSSISSASVRSIPFLSFILPIFAWNVPLVSLIFLKNSLDWTELIILFEYGK